MRAMRRAGACTARDGLRPATTGRCARCTQNSTAAAVSSSSCAQDHVHATWVIGGNRRICCWQKLAPQLCTNTYCEDIQAHLQLRHRLARRHQIPLAAAARRPPARARSPAAAMRRRRAERLRASWRRERLLLLLLLDSRRDKGARTAAAAAGLRRWDGAGGAAAAAGD